LKKVKNVLHQHNLVYMPVIESAIYPYGWYIHYTLWQK